MNTVLTGLLPGVVPELALLLVLVTDVVAFWSGPTSGGARVRMVYETSRSAGVPPSQLHRTIRSLSRSRPLPAHLRSLVPLAQPIAITVLEIDARAFGRIRSVAPFVLPAAAGLLLFSIVAAVIGGTWVLPAYLVGIYALGIAMLQLVFLWIGPGLVRRRLRALQPPSM